jgi:hypothetical protein
MGHIHGPLTAVRGDQVLTKPSLASVSTHVRAFSRMLCNILSYAKLDAACHGQLRELIAGNGAGKKEE